MTVLIVINFAMPKNKKFNKLNRDIKSDKSKSFCPTSAQGLKTN